MPRVSSKEVYDQGNVNHGSTNDETSPIKKLNEHESSNMNPAVDASTTRTQISELLSELERWKLECETKTKRIETLEQILRDENKKSNPVYAVPRTEFLQIDSTSSFAVPQTSQAESNRHETGESIFCVQLSR